MIEAMSRFAYALFLLAAGVTVLAVFAMIVFAVIAVAKFVAA